MDIPDHKNIENRIIRLNLLIDIQVAADYLEKRLEVLLPDVDLITNFVLSRVKKGG